MARRGSRAVSSTVIEATETKSKIYTEIRPRSYFDDLRQWLGKHVEAGTNHVCRFQKFFGVGEPRDTWGKAIFYSLSNIYFRMATILGDEITFVVLLPFFWWHFSGDLSVRVVLVWSLSCYLGHVGKDLFELPRPPAPAVQLEKYYAHEYGLPSTHAISATTFPLCVLMECIEQGCSMWIVCPLLLLWFVSVCCSRLYLGVHSPADLLAGILVGLVVFWASFPLVDLIVNHHLVHNPSVVLYLLPAAITLLVYAYPASKKWTTAYGDAATILAVFNGGCIHLGYHGTQKNLYQLNLADLTDFGGVASSAWMRVFIGYVIVAFTRSFMRKSTEFLLVMVLPKSDQPPKQRYAVEIPSKFITYTVVTLAASVAGPMAMHSLVQ